MEWKNKIMYSWQCFGENIIRNVFELSNVSTDKELTDDVFEKVSKQLEVINQGANVEYFIGKSICYELRKAGYFVNTYNICMLVTKFIGEAKRMSATKMQA